MRRKAIHEAVFLGTFCACQDHSNAAGELNDEREAKAGRREGDNTRPPSHRTENQCDGDRDGDQEGNDDEQCALSPHSGLIAQVVHVVFDEARHATLKGHRLASAYIDYKCVDQALSISDLHAYVWVWWIMVITRAKMANMARCCRTTNSWRGLSMLCFMKRVALRHHDKEETLLLMSQT